MPELVGVAVIPLAWNLVQVAIWAWTASPTPEGTPGLSFRIPQRAYHGFVVSLFLLLLLFTPFPTGVISGTAGFLTGRYVVARARRREFGLPVLLPAIAVVFAASVVTGVVNGRPSIGMTRERVAFTTEAAIKDGEFVYLGRKDGSVFLRPCFEKRPTVMAVRADAIVSETFVRSKRRGVARPSLFQVILGDAGIELGLSYPC